ncbi:receptor-like protein kinase FERONIA [Humulus lupulus]|uniref:receptor-like protein kinase FERONIA n=1 Tax=Humulus lupulus TaxID=3486 RepID=UPI002B417500|nr:receptor-like protein kinase FERONIA [Humulus lupulus]
MIFLMLYLLFVFNAITNSVTDGKPLLNSYGDDIALDCGSSSVNSTRQGEGRSWDGDVSSKLFVSTSQNNSASRNTEAVNKVDEVPYRTARFSHSEFTYTIPVISGIKFIRLHFSSAKYKDFDNSKAFFSVEAGQYNFLRNFSVILNSKGLCSGDKLVKEFCVAVETSNLTLKFSPTSSISDAIAFVNGIEIVSMPADLYYSEHEGYLNYVGQVYRYVLNNNTAMENVYRVNIGGQFISPAEADFFRSWEDLNCEQSLYLTMQSYLLSALPPMLPNASLVMSKRIAHYIAPQRLYQTARSMGRTAAINKGYNLTWEFPLDVGFYYMVRLHFCEIDPRVKSEGDRRFIIFMLNQTVERYADVIAWSGGQYSPYFKDYIVWVDKGVGEKKKNLSIALQANPDDGETTYSDAILNGVEIFKLNDTEGNLAGPNPDLPHLPSMKNEIKNKTNRTSIIGIISGVVSGAAVTLSFIGFLVLRRGRKVKASGHISLTATKSSKTGGSSSLPSDRCRYFSLVEVIDATNNFEDIFIIGVGGFGNVYKGYIDNGTTPVAIKRLKSESSQGIQEFKTEIELLSHLRHRHLVSLIGYCNDDREMILVYDYMAHGTLRDHLYKTENPPLTWKQRLEICIGAANGLHYLHTGTEYTIIHRDVKTTNILLDEKWVAKVSDFGLSKTGPTSMSKGHLTTVVKGSVGYLDPEYYRRQQLTEKSDVYSFGVVLCEALCGRPPIVRTAEKGQVSLAEWVQSCYHNGRLNEIIDPYLTGKIAPECLKKYGELTVQCMLDNGTERPSMKDIVWGLEFAMQLQNNAEGNDSVGGKIMKTMSVEEVALLKNYSNDSDGAFTSSWADTTESKSNTVTKIISSSEQGSTTDDSRKGMSGTVFSEITDYPNGR